MFRSLFQIPLYRNNHKNGDKPQETGKYRPSISRCNPDTIQNRPMLPKISLREALTATLIHFEIIECKKQKIMKFKMLLTYVANFNSTTTVLCVKKYIH